MTAYTYPGFEGGETLTAADLTALREFVEHRDRDLGRAIGFGVNCGLQGSISGATLTVGPGLAVDQTGEPLVMAAAAAIALPPAGTGQVYDFIAAGPGGFSVVLEATDSKALPPACGQPGCTKHAAVHTRDVALRVVPGRIAGARFDFAGEPLLSASPMALSLTSNPQGSFVTLRNALTARLAGRIRSDLHSKLAGISIAPSDLPGEKGFKAGFINQVLFAALDLLRCEALMGLACDRTTSRPGVVLGWLESSGASFVWHCRYRHAWEPPPGLAAAMLGGTCTDPCQAARDLLEGLIANYVEPDPPTSPPPGQVDPGIFEYCPKGWAKIGGKCINIKVALPPEKIPDLWKEPFVVDPLGPIWDPPHDWQVDLPLLYDTDPLDYLDSGVVDLSPAWGLDAQGVKDALDAKLGGIGGAPDPNVVLARADAVAGMAGYAPTAAASPADTIVLAHDTAGRVVATGRVPAAATARTVGTALPAATAKAAAALESAGRAQEQAAAVDQAVLGLRDDVGSLGQFRTEIAAWKVSMESVVAGIGPQIEQTVQDRYGSQLIEMQQRMAGMEGSLDVLKGRPSVAGPAAAKVMPEQFAAAMVEYAESMNAGLSSLVRPENEGLLGRYVRDVARAASRLELAVAENEPQAVTDAALEVLDTMRTAVKSAGIEAGLATQIDAQFRMMRDLIR